MGQFCGFDHPSPARLNNPYSVSSSQRFSVTKCCTCSQPRREEQLAPGSRCALISSPLLRCSLSLPLCAAILLQEKFVLVEKFQERKQVDACRKVLNVLAVWFSCTTSVLYLSDPPSSSPAATFRTGSEHPLEQAVL